MFMLCICVGGMVAISFTGGLSLCISSSVKTRAPLARNHPSSPSSECSGMEISGPSQSGSCEVPHPRDSQTLYACKEVCCAARMVGRRGKISRGGDSMMTVTDW